MNEARAFALQRAFVIALAEFMETEAGEGLTYPELFKAIEDLREPLLEKYIARHPAKYFKPQKRGET